MANDLIDALRSGFITCNCPGDGSGYVKIRFTQLRDAQELHRLIVTTLTEEPSSALVGEVAEKIADEIFRASERGEPKWSEVVRVIRADPCRLQASN